MNMRKGKFVLAGLVFCVVVWPAVVWGQAASRPAGATTAAAEPDASDATSGNLTILRGRHWRDVLGGLFWVVVTVVLWSVGLGFLGLILGAVVYFRLRKGRMFDAVANTPSRFGWAWMLLFVLMFGAGGAYGGGWLGLERGIKNEILTRRVVDGLIVSAIQANILNAMDIELTGKESGQELQEMVAESEAAADLAMEDFMAVVDKVIDDRAKGRVARWVVEIARDQIREKLLDKLKDRMHGVDPRLLAIAIFECGRREYLDKYPKAKPAAAMWVGFLNTIRLEACKRVTGFTRTGMWTGFLGGLLIPLLALFIFRKTVCRKSPAQSG